MNKLVAIDGSKQLVEAIDAASDGQTIVLTFGGKPVGRLSVDKPRDRDAAEAAYESILSREMQLDGLNLLDLRNEGRKG